MKTVKSRPATSKGAKVWQKTPYANLLRYIPSGVYFCRIRVKGVLIRKSLKTDVLSVAKLRLADEEKICRQNAEHQDAIQRGRGQMTFDEAMDVYKTRLEADPNLKTKTKSYYEQRIDSLKRTWPELGKMNLRNLTKQDCLDWAASFEGSSTAFNNNVLVLRMILDIAIERGVIYENVAKHITRRAVRPKDLHLPDKRKFAEFVKVIRDAGGRFSRDCADMVQFLAFGGFRLGEANNITWSDCDFTKNEIVVRGDPTEATKNGEIRRVPMIGEMRQLLQRLKAENMDARPEDRVVRVGECKIAMDTATQKLGMAHLTHHDLRHLFATTCIEDGVDVPTISRWLGHKDGGALAMKVYGHLRDQHSKEMAEKVRFSTSTVDSSKPEVDSGKA